MVSKVFQSLVKKKGISYNTLERYLLKLNCEFVNTAYYETFIWYINLNFQHWIQTEFQYVHLTAGLSLLVLMHIAYLTLKGIAN